MPIIRLAIEGREEMIGDILEMVFGKPTVDASEVPPEAKPLTMNHVQGVFAMLAG